MNAVFSVAVAIQLLLMLAVFASRSSDQAIEFVKDFSSTIVVIVGCTYYWIRHRKISTSAKTLLRGSPVVATGVLLGLTAFALLAQDSNRIRFAILIYWATVGVCILVWRLTRRPVGPNFGTFLYPVVVGALIPTTIVAIVYAFQVLGGG